MSRNSDKRPPRASFSRRTGRSTTESAGQSLTACDGCTPVICCYDTAHGYQYPRWTPANLSSNYDCSA